MSLEAAVLANTTAIEALTAAVLASNAGRAAAVEQITGGAAAEPATRRRGAPAKATAAEPAAVAATPAAMPAPAAAEAPKEISTEDFRTAGGVFMQTTDEAVRQTRRGFVKSIIDHLGVEKFTDVLPENRVQVLGWLKAHEAGKTVNFSEGEDEPVVAEEEAEDDMLG